MKSIFLCLTMLCGIAIAGCGAPSDNSLATDGTTEDEFAKYEADLAAVSGGESYEDAEDDDSASE